MLRRLSVYPLLVELKNLNQWKLLNDIKTLTVSGNFNGGMYLHTLNGKGCRNV